MIQVTIYMLIKPYLSNTTQPYRILQTLYYTSSSFSYVLKLTGYFKIYFAMYSVLMFPITASKNMI